MKILFLWCQRRSDVEKYSAYKYFQEEDIENIKNLLNQFHFSYGEINNDNALFLANSLVKHVENLKMQNKLDHNFKLNFTSTFIPPNGEVTKIGGGLMEDTIFTHSKIAPWYVDGVIDNSGSALPPLNYILGREMEHSYGDYYEDFPHNSIFFLKTHWTVKKIHLIFLIMKIILLEHC